MQQFKPFKIGKYLLLERLATGGMAEVYRAKASGAGGFEKQLAIKRIIPSYAENDEFRRMFEYEARLSSLLNHANIVHVYDFVKSGETYLLAMEFVDGRNLRQVVNKAKKANFPLPLEFGVYVINEVCKGLDYAHNLRDTYQGKHLNVIHRDMSPQNIMISYDGSVKIVDFGIAKARDRVDETRSGVIKGKFGYMSPEQASGQEIDHRSDVFSTLIILYELVTNRRLFASENDMATLRRIQECIVQRPSLVNPKISPVLEKLLLKGLTKDRNLRYQQAGELQQKLQEYLNRYHPTFNQHSIQQVMFKLFRGEIEQEKRRLEQVYQQSIPYSQQHIKDSSEDDGEAAEVDLDGDLTKSEHEPDSLVTKVTDSSDLDAAEAPAPTGPELGFDQNERLPEVLPEDDAPPTVARERSGPAELSHLGENEDSNTFNTLADTGLEDSFAGSLPREPSASRSESATVPRGKALPQGRGAADADPPAPVEDNAPTVVADTTGEVSESFTVAPISEPPPEESNTTGRPDSIGGNDRIELRLDTESLVDSPPQTPRLGSFARALGKKAPPPSEPTIDAQRPPRPARFTRPEPPRRSFAGRVARALSSAMVISAVAGTLYYYFSLEEPAMMPPPAGERNTSAVTPSPESVIDPSASRRLAPGKKPCSTKVQSDPSGANVFANGENIGKTPTVAFVECNADAVLQIQLDGYEPVQERVTVRQPKQNYYRTLKKIPSGIIEITVSQNARVYLDGNLQDQEIKPGVPFRLRVRADVKHTVLLVNDTLKLRTQKEYTLKENELFRDRVRLFPDPGARVPARKR